MDVAFTFGIITDGSPEALARLDLVLSSIHTQNMPAYEIVIIGHAPTLRGQRNTRLIPFDESVRPRWITRKKNLITQAAHHANVVYMHDYVQLEPGWYEGWQQFGPRFKACMNPIVNPDGSRYRDWTMFFDPSSKPARKFAGAHPFENLLPYTETSVSKLMYFSGAYFVAKRQVMMEIPLDERLSWGEGEDVIWSHRFRAKYPFSINPYSRVRFVGKHKDPIFRPIPPSSLARMKAYLAKNPPEPGYGTIDDLELWRQHGHFAPAKKASPTAKGAA